MSSSPLLPQPVRAGSRRPDAASVTPALAATLERFWPSRRGHAFDEFCH